jgi:hypothetical protein
MDDLAKGWLASYSKDGKGGPRGDYPRPRQMSLDLAGQHIDRPMQCASKERGRQQYGTAYYYAMGAKAGIVRAEIRYADMQLILQEA